MGDMARLVRVDQTGHTTLAEWTPADPAAIEGAVAALRSELDRGYYAVVNHGEGRAEQVQTLPVDAELVILRRPIAGGGATPPRCLSARPSPGARRWTSAGCACTRARGRPRRSSTRCRWCSSPGRC